MTSRAKTSGRAASRRKAGTGRKPAARRTEAQGSKRSPSSAKAKSAPKPNGPAPKASSLPSQGLRSESMGTVTPLAPVTARPTRDARAQADARMAEIDEVCAAWADIVAERISADQAFADLVEQLAHQSRDLRGLFLWDALQAAEAHVALINDVLAAHVHGRRADPIAILADLRARRLRIAAVYAVNSFLAVLNQMKPKKPKWLANDDMDPRFAVLALAHQTLGYALEAAHVEAPPDVTDHILSATQDEAVWVWRRMPEPGTDTLAACAAAAAFFRGLGSTVLATTDEVAALYGEHATHRAAS